MSPEEIKTIITAVSTLLAIPGVGWFTKLVISHYFKLSSDRDQKRDELDKERVARQNEVNDRTKEVANDLKDRQRELSDSFHAVSDVLNQMRSAIAEMQKAFSDLRLDVEKSNAKYDLLTSKFIEYVPIANKRIETLESAFGKIIQK